MSLTHDDKSVLQQQQHSDDAHAQVDRVDQAKAVNYIYTFSVKILEVTLNATFTNI